jgi:hypothetical protein
LKCFDIPQEIIDFKNSPDEIINKQTILQPTQVEQPKAIQPNSIEIIPTINEPTMPTLISHSLQNKKSSLCTLFIKHSRIIALLGFGSIIGAWLLYYHSFLSLHIDQ